MKIVILVFCAALFCHEVIAQQKLVPNKPVAKTISPGVTDSFLISLQDGDYAGASIVQSGKVSVAISYPDGSLLRRYEFSSGDAKNPFAFVAERGGSYSIKITNPDEKPVKYQLQLEKVLPLAGRVAPDPWQDPTPVPRIQALKSRIASGQKNTDAFWKEVAAVGTPLVDPFPSDDRYQLVTFLWRSTYETNNVLVIGSFWIRPLAAYMMHQIPNSEVWYLTLKLPTGARFTYQLSPNDPLTSEGDRAGHRSLTRQSDPLNTNPLKCPPGTAKFICRSVAELPGAVPQPWASTRSGIPKGRVETFKIKSNIQKIERPISVYTPPSYKPGGPPNALVILFDGEDLRSDTYRINTLNNLIADSKIPGTVAVFVENVPRRRLVDLVANSEFTDFLASELVPWIRERYNVTRDASKVVVGGQSAGGIAAPYAALRHPEIFGNSMSLSGAFWWSPEHHGGVCGARCPESGGRGGDDSVDATTEGNWMAKQFLASPRLPLRFYLTAGTFEVDWSAEGGSILETTRQLRDVLLAQGYEVHYRQFHGGHDGMSWRGALAEGLIALLSPR